MRVKKFLKKISNDLGSDICWIEKDNKGRNSISIIWEYEYNVRCFILLNGFKIVDFEDGHKDYIKYYISK